MSVKTKLEYSLNNILNTDNSGSFATRYDRHRILRHFVEQLLALGYKLPKIRGLKQKHVLAVVEHWKAQKISSSTMKNRLAVLRYLTALMNQSHIVPSNQALGIEPRRYYSSVNKALKNPDFTDITNEHIRISLELQRVFGLRREESLKIKPHMADKKDKLELYPTWCKGGRGRTVLIRTEEQRYWLERAKAMAGKFDHSLIPSHTNYRCEPRRAESEGE